MWILLNKNNNQIDLSATNVKFLIKHFFFGHKQCYKLEKLNYVRYFVANCGWAFLIKRAYYICILVFFVYKHSVNKTKRWFPFIYLKRLYVEKISDKVIPFAFVAATQLTAPEQAYSINFELYIFFCTIF